MVYSASAVLAFHEFGDSFYYFKRQLIFAVLGILAMFAVGLQLTWLGKHTLFRFPVRGLLRWLGGEPVGRDPSEGA